MTLYGGKPGVRSSAPSPSSVTCLSFETLRAILEPPLPTGLWLVALGPFLLGVLVVLGPLELDRLGWGATAVGAVFLLSGLAGAVAHPLLGRWSDERGPRVPARAGLFAGALVFLALPLAGDPWFLALLVVLVGATSNATVTPGTSLFSSGAEKASTDQGTIFGAVNFVWSCGYALGAPLAGVAAGAVGDWASHLSAGAMCLGTLLLTQRAL